MDSVCIILSLFIIFISVPDTLGSEGCKEGIYGISCCSKGFNTGDNVNGDNEIFIQANEYENGCIQSCKKLHPTSIGVTESLVQRYTSGKGLGQNKCWCELEYGNLDPTKLKYQTCLLTIPDAQPLAVQNQVPSAQPLAVQNEEEDAEEEGIRASFYLFDHNGDGQVTVPEWKQAYISMEPESATNPNLDTGLELSMTMADTNRDRKMNVDEYVAWYKATVPKQEAGDDLMDDTQDALFKHYDADRNGMFNHGEFKEFVKFLNDGAEPNYFQLAGLKQLFDQNYDGQISLREFNDYIASKN